MTAAIICYFLVICVSLHLPVFRPYTVIQIFHHADEWHIFVPVEDPRVERTKRHRLRDIIILAMCGVICGAEGWVEIEEFGRAIALDKSRMFLYNEGKCCSSVKE